MFALPTIFAVGRIAETHSHTLPYISHAKRPVVFQALSSGLSLDTRTSSGPIYLPKKKRRTYKMQHSASQAPPYRDQEWTDSAKLGTMHPAIALILFLSFLGYVAHKLVLDHLFFCFKF